MWLVSFLALYYKEVNWSKSLHLTKRVDWNTGNLQCSGCALFCLWIRTDKAYHTCHNDLVTSLVYFTRKKTLLVLLQVITREVSSNIHTWTVVFFFSSFEQVQPQFWSFENLNVWWILWSCLGSMCWQGSCNRANSKPNDKPVEATSADSTTSYLGFNLVIVAAPAAARIAVHSFLVAHPSVCGPLLHCRVSRCLSCICYPILFHDICPPFIVAWRFVAAWCGLYGLECECHCDWNEKRPFL